MNPATYKLVPALVKHEGHEPGDCWDCAGCVAENDTDLCDEISCLTGHDNRICNPDKIFILDTPEAFAEYIARRMCGETKEST